MHSGGRVIPPAHQCASGRMTTIHLRPGIAHCVFTDCAIILDIDRDRYWQVSRHVAGLLEQVQRGESGRLAPADQACLEHLGLVEAAADNISPRAATPPLPPGSSALEEEALTGRFRSVEALEVACLALAARRRVRHRPLRSVLAEIGRWRDRGKPDLHADAMALARRFARYRRLVPLAALCLPDTIAFLHFAARRGCFPQLVFGVEAWPFAAHCWAQQGDCVLTDALHHARSYSPILVL